MKKTYFYLVFMVLLTCQLKAEEIIVPIKKPQIKQDEDGTVIVLENIPKSNTITVTKAKTNNISNNTSAKNSGNVSKSSNKTNVAENNINYEFVGGTTSEEKKEDKKEEKKAETNKPTVAQKTTKGAVVRDNKEEDNNTDVEDTKKVTKVAGTEYTNKNEVTNTKVNDKNKNISKTTVTKTTNDTDDEDVKETTQKVAKNTAKPKNKTENYNTQSIEYIKIDDADKKQLAKVVKSSNYTSNSNNLKLINKIEQNLMYNTSGKKRTDTKIDIKKGTWSKEDLAEVKTDSKLGITTKSSSSIKLDVKETEKDKKIANLKEKAFEAINLREYEIAIKLYKEILAINKDDNFVKLSLATAYHILGQYLQAKPLYIELLSVFPNSEQLVSNLLSIIIQESPYEAIYLLPSLAKKYNNSAVIQAQTSVAFSTVERYDEAIKYIQLAIYLDEDNIEYKYNLAVLYDVTKQYERAYRLYRNVYDIAKANNITTISTSRIEARMKKLKRYV
ncbi:MAG: hypothetical protein IJ853_01390 [Rickettsiales bacterium]|nr:hypothetical protein [Rickettsiales bacterium]